MKSLSPMYVGSSGLGVRRHNVARLAIISLITCFFLAMFATSAFAQEATIVGTITDPTGAAVPKANVNITNTDTGIVRTIATGGDGQYVAPDLHIGHYVVRVEAGGFKVGERKDINLQVGDRTRVDFTLEVGNQKETVTVEANAVAVQTDTGEVSGVITGQQVSQLATNGRSVFTLEPLQPGASSIQADFQVPTSAGGDFNVSFNGERVSHNLWLVDGGEAADRGGGGGADVLPSEDAIAEFRTMTSNYSAEYGLSSAGTVSMVIKSGTRQLHATAFYFGRNNALDARNYFNPAPNQFNPTPDPVAELRFNDFGFNVGGPVSVHPSKSTPKTFFFYNMEWRRYVAGGIYNQVVPYTSTYGGNFASNLPTSSKDPLTGNVVPNSGLHVPCGYQLSSALKTAFNNAGITTFSTPGSSGGTNPQQICSIPSLAQEQQANPATDPVFQAFPSNAIPAALVNSNATALLGAGIFPAPTSGDSFIGGNKSPTTGKEEIARIDHQFSDKFSIFGHFIADQAIQTYGETQWSSDNVPTVFNTFNNPSYSATIHATYTVNPTLLNEIAFNYDGNRIHILPAPGSVYQDPSGFTENSNRIFSGTNADNRIPDIHLAGSTGTYYTVNWLPWNNQADDYQIRDDVSWTRGAHQFRFGGSWALYKKAQDYFAETQGGFTFNGFYTGNDFADYLLGYAQGYSEQAYKGTGYWNAVSPALYVQDNWRATHRLTLNLGLRWDGIPHTYEANNNMSNFYPNLYNSSTLPTWVAGSNFGQIASNSPGLGPTPTSIASLQGYQFYLNGIGFEGKNGIPKGLVNNTWDAFGPRIGFAYDVTGRGNTVIRGGFGTMYERIQGNDMYNAATNPGFGYSLNTNYVSLSNPHNSITGAAISVPIVPASVTGINQSYKVPTSYSYSAGVQQAIGKNAVLSVSYVGNQNRYQSYYQEINTPPAADLANLQAGSSATPFNGLVPYQGFAQIKQAFTGQNSHYNSLQSEVHGHVTHDLYVQGAFTLSRAIDPSTGNGNGWDLDPVSNPYVGWKYDNGPSLFDRTAVAFVNFVYDIPFLKNSSDKLLRTTVGGWQFSGIVMMQSGAPYNLGINGTNVASVFPGGDVANRPNITGSVSYPKTAVTSSGRTTGIQWINPAVYSSPAAGTWGNAGFDSVRGPGRDNWNLALFKRFIISESRGSEFQFRAESFNTWNHTQFGGAGQNGGFSGNFGAGNFGQVTGAFDPRVFQLGAKLIF